MVISFRIAKIEVLQQRPGWGGRVRRFHHPLAPHAASISSNQLEKRLQQSSFGNTIKKIAACGTCSSREQFHISHPCQKQSSNQEASSFELFVSGCLSSTSSSPSSSMSSLVRFLKTGSLRVGRISSRALDQSFPYSLVLIKMLNT